MYAELKNSIASWVFNWRGPEVEPVVLGRKRIYILPSRAGYTFALVLLVMLTGSINYSLGLGFVLTFLLGSLGVNAMVHTFRNLVNLRATGGRARPVFAGEVAQFTVHLENNGALDRYAIGLTVDRRNATFVDIRARTIAAAIARVPAQRRGILKAGR